MARHGSDFEVEAKKGSSLMIPFKVLGLTLALCLGFFFYYFGPSLEEMRGAVPEPSESTERVDVQFRDVLMQIPANFMQFPRDRRGGRQTEVVLHAILPELEPFSPEKKDIFDADGADNPILYFKVSDYNLILDEDVRFDQLYLQNLESSEGEKGEYGFKVYHFSDESGYRGKDLFVQKEDNGSVILIMCNRQSETDPFPSCHRETRLSEALALRYQYKRYYLSQWKKIDADIRALALSWHTEDLK